MLLAAFKYNPLMSRQGCFHSKPGVLVHTPAPWDSSNDSWQQSKADFPGDAKSKEQCWEVSSNLAWPGCLSLTTRKVAIFCVLHEPHTKGSEKIRQKLSTIFLQFHIKMWGVHDPLCGPKCKEFEQGMAPVKLNGGIFAVAGTLSQKEARFRQLYEVPGEVLEQQNRGLQIFYIIEWH